MLQFDFLIAAKLIHFVSDVVFEALDVLFVRSIVDEIKEYARSIYSNKAKGYTAKKKHKRFHMVASVMVVSFSNSTILLSISPVEYLFNPGKELK